jgi:hypothetical protein
MTLLLWQEKQVSLTVGLLEREVQPMTDPAAQRELYFGYVRYRTAPYIDLIGRVLARMTVLSAELTILLSQKLC